jgi:hypothetical protein
MRLMQGLNSSLAIIVLVYRQNVGQQNIIECLGLKLISQFTVCPDQPGTPVAHGTRMGGGYHDRAEINVCNEGSS